MINTIAINATHSQVGGLVGPACSLFFAGLGAGAGEGAGSGVGAAEGGGTAGCPDTTRV